MPLRFHFLKASTINLDPQNGAGVWLAGLWHGLWVFVGFFSLFTLFFAPIVFQGLLFGHGDGLVYYLAAFLSPPQLWSDLIFGGYPIAADPQMMSWYPPALLLRWIPGSWNAFNILGYALSASFAYCYGWITTGSRIAAIGAGLVYSLSGFVLGHLSHTTGVHSAAWIPLFLAALEQLSQRFDRRWWAIAIMAIAGCVLAGHPQVAVYGVGLGVIYAAMKVWRSPVGWQRYVLIASSVFAIGLLLCTIQILPTWQLSRLSVRAEMPFEAFATQFALPNWQTLHMLFPYLFGGAGHPPYSATYWGQWLFVDVVGYVGLMPLMLGAVALFRHRSRRLVIFWVIFGLVAFLVTLGGDTPLAKVLYQVPLYNKFRAQGRHMVEVAMAASALTGFGIATIQRHWISRRLITIIIAGLGGLMLLGWGWLYGNQTFYQTLASAKGVVLEIQPWRNPAIGIPCLTWGLSAVAVLLLHKQGKQVWMQVLFSGLLLWDLASFSWFWTWQPPAAKAEAVRPPAVAQVLRDRLAVDHQRLFTSQGGMRAGTLGLAPNMTRAWQLPNASGYTPLMLARVGQLLRMNQIGVVNWPPAGERDRSFDLMAIRYLLVPPPLTLQSLPVSAASGLPWAAEDIPWAVGNGACAADLNPVNRIDLPTDGSPVSAIGVVSQLGCAANVGQNQEVAKIEAVGVDGQVTTASIQAGRDTSEWAYDCLPAQAQAKHQRAKVFRQTPLPQEAIAQFGNTSDKAPDKTQCAANAYVSIIPLKSPQTLKQLAITSTPVAGVASTRLDIYKLLLIHGNQSNPSASSTVSPVALPFGLIVNLEGTPRWQRSANLEDDTAVYENRLAMPRAWLVPELLRATPEAMLSAIQTSQLPDGRTFDPRRLALVENAESQKLPDLQPTDIVKIDTIADTQVNLQTQTASPAFLILSDVDYPGWQVTIDGKKAPLLQVNYVQRGVQLPAGNHSVQFVFRPRILKVAMGASLVALLMLVLGVWGLGKSLG